MPWSCWFDGTNHWFYVNGKFWIWLEGQWNELTFTTTFINTNELTESPAFP